ncbi:hypothetical protein RFH42_03090 [Acinetobacter rudis]|uniref:hypothetical protein n=1 Tax=Acinetobacter rudis TaxID=632955 RepID=UPI00280DD9FC|nr:hypothetical protein [Acinetobacter rudis]MDQ8951939.1 hypothetical protein [Acinetobacter rudis]
MKKLFIMTMIFVMSSVSFAATTDKIANNQTYKIEMRTGEDKSISVPITVIFDQRFEKSISKKYISDISNSAFEKAKKMNLKNPYSFKPREVTVEQVSNTLEFIAKYTAENSYGSDVIGEIRIVKFLWDDGLYHDKPQ